MILGRELQISRTIFVEQAAGIIITLDWVRFMFIGIGGRGEAQKERRQTAQLISLCIYGHHAGLPDCLTASGRSPHLDGLREQPENYYIEAMENFYTEVASRRETGQVV